MVERQRLFDRVKAIMSQRAKTSLINFLLEVVPSALDCSRQQLTSLLTGKGDEQLKRFLREADVHCLIVGKEVVESDVGGESSPDGLKLEESISGENRLDYSDGPAQHKVFIETYMTSRCLKASLMVFVKNPGFQVSEDGIITTSADRGAEQAEPTAGESPEDHSKGTGAASHIKSLSSSMQCIQLGFVGSQLTPYEVLNQYLQFAFTPLLDVLGNAKGASGAIGGESGESGDPGETGSRLGLDNIQRKVNELCLALQQGQDDSMIPMVRLSLDSRVSEYAKEYKSTGKVGVIDEIMEDSAFLSSLQVSITQWIREIQSLARFQRDIGLSVTSEVKFWSSYERSLLQIQKQVQSPEVEWTLSVLRQSKKFLAAISLEVDTGLKQSIERVQNINTLIQDIPINDLLVATSIDEITSALGLFFQQLRKIKGAASYPISRTFQLVEVYSSDMNKQIYKVLNSNPTTPLMLLEFPVFEHLVNGCNELGQVWEDEWRELKEVIRDLIKKRGLSERAHPKMDFAHVPLIQRLNDIVVFRKQHQKLKDTLLELLSVQGATSGDSGDQNPLSALGIEQNSGLDALQSLAKKDLQQAYACVANINILDLSAVGLETWEAGKQAYNNKVDASETLLIKQLREQLSGCGNTLEMFRILGRYNPLFFRPRIRSAVEEYQSILLDKVQSDFQLLQLRYQNPYQRSAASQFSCLRDIPNIGGMLVWSHLLQERIQSIYLKLEDIFGPNWEFESQGHKVKTDGDHITSKIHPNQIVDFWLQQRKDDKTTYDLSKPVLGLMKSGNTASSAYVLASTIDSGGAVQRQGSGGRAKAPVPLHLAPELPVHQLDEDRHPAGGGAREADLPVANSVQTGGLQRDSGGYRPELVVRPAGGLHQEVLRRGGHAGAEVRGCDDPRRAALRAGFPDQEHPGEQGAWGPGGSSEQDHVQVRGVPVPLAGLQNRLPVLLGPGHPVVSSPEAQGHRDHPAAQGPEDRVESLAGRREVFVAETLPPGDHQNHEPAQSHEHLQHPPDIALLWGNQEGQGGAGRPDLDRQSRGRPCQLCQ
ncbi:dynein heavy chain [Cryptosporidium canis]|uniref:Dynein heavy chain n=1 Tax=Cryptosporidium canis TaxID=195482 RepID=A0A9D5DE56_9CRYT|nr:dynein heavy chain [Cryptosporidium canis]